MPIKYSYDTERCLGWLMRFLSIEGVTGEEKAVAEDVIRVLRDVGVPASAIRFDDAHKRIPLPTQTGNLIVNLKGNRRWRRRMFMTHLDTVPLCAGAVPKRVGKRIVADSPTALGADNRVGVTCLVNLIANVVERDIPHPPLTVVFTVREESGLWGARHLNLRKAEKAPMCFNVDGRSPDQLAIGAVGADRWYAEVFGRASHAGVHPEDGISATIVTSLALSEVWREGWFGRVNKDGKTGTSNVGSIGDAQGRSAGNATNVVTDYAMVRGECRSHSAAFIGKITAAYRNAFRDAAKQVKNAKGKTAQVKFHAERDYHPFRLKKTDPVVVQAVKAAKRIGLEPELRAIDGGLDANWLVRHGIPTVTFGGGQNNVHTVDEYVDIPDFLTACEYALALASEPDPEK